MIAYAREERARRLGAAGEIQIAREYHTGLAHAEQFRNGLLPRLKRCGVPAGARVLEVGAGMGYIAAMLAAAGVERVIATDPDWREASPRTPLFVGPFQSIHAQWPLDGVVSFETGRQEFNARRLAFIRADGLRLPFRDASFDIAFSHGSLEHFPDIEGVFREMLRVVKPGGLLYGESEKFWAARDGSHFDEVFPAPWLHLLVAPERMWELYESLSGGRDLLWPGRFLDREFFLRMLTRDLNRRGVRPIRRMILAGDCDLVFWQQSTRPEDRALLKHLGLRPHLRQWPLEELLTSHLAFGVRKRPARLATRLTLRFPWRWKQLVPERWRHAVRERLRPPP